MKKTIILAFVVCTILGATKAQTTKKESIKQLFALMKQDSLMQQTFENIPMLASNPLTQQKPDSAHQAQYTETIKMVKEITSELYPKMLEDMVDCYDKYFTQEEINEYIRFYSSAAGQKMINNTPMIMKEVMSMVQSKYMGKILASIMLKSVKPDSVTIQEPTLRPDAASEAQMKAEFLDMETSNPQGWTEEQKQIFKKAQERVERYVDVENNQFVLKVGKASDLNMSERLFELLKGAMSQSNQALKVVLEKQKSK